MTWRLLSQRTDPFWDKVLSRLLSRSDELFFVKWEKPSCTFVLLSAFALPRGRFQACSSFEFSSYDLQLTSATKRNSRFKWIESSCSFDFEGVWHSQSSDSEGQFRFWMHLIVEAPEAIDQLFLEFPITGSWKLQKRDPPAFSTLARWVPGNGTFCLSHVADVACSALESWSCLLCARPNTGTNLGCSRAIRSQVDSLSLCQHMLKFLRLDTPKSCVSVGLRLSHLVRAFIFWLLDDIATESLAFGNAFLSVFWFWSFNKC